MERRYTPPGTLKVESRADGTKYIIGYGAVFYRENDTGTEYRLWPDLVERVAATAFSRAIREKQDVRGLFNHDTNHVLGRTSAGTMTLSVDSVGLRYEITPPDTQSGRDVLALVSRGDITGSSFSFSVQKESILRGANNSPDVRVLEDVDLYDVGPVTFPAYEAATAGVRGESDAGEARKAYEAWRNGIYEIERESRKRRLRILDIS
jgi:HK97 family phage prohead protease